MIYFTIIILWHFSESDDTTGLIFSVLFLILFYKITRWYEKNNWPKKGRKGQPLPNKIVFDAINSIWEDKTFIDEFRYILYDEGNINEFTKEIHKCHVNGEGTHHNGRIWYDVNDTLFEPHSITNRIIERVTKTTQFQNQILKYDLNGKDLEDFKKLFMYIVSKQEFCNIAREYLIKLKIIKPGEDVLNLNPYSNLDRSLKINPWELLGAIY
jgi:hypothetical protein